MIVTGNVINIILRIEGTIKAAVRMLVSKIISFCVVRLCFIIHSLYSYIHALIYSGMSTLNKLAIQAEVIAIKVVHNTCSLKSAM